MMAARAIAAWYVRASPVVAGCNAAEVLDAAEAALDEVLSLVRFWAERV